MDNNNVEGSKLHVLCLIFAPVNLRRLFLWLFFLSISLSIVVFFFLLALCKCFLCANRDFPFFLVPTNDRKDPPTLIFSLMLYWGIEHIANNQFHVSIDFSLLLSILSPNDFRSYSIFLMPLLYRWKCIVINVCTGRRSKTVLCRRHSDAW